MVRNYIVAVLFVGVLAAPEARAQAGGGQGWSVLAGQTVGAGRMAVHGQVGFPGLSAGLLGGVADNFDFGGRFTFNYAAEGQTGPGAFIPGLKLQALLRLGLVNTGRFNLALNFEPGPFTYFSRFETYWGLVLPVPGVAIGFPIGSALMINGGLDLPFYVLFGYGVYFPVLIRGGLEYFIDRNLALTFNLGFGPTIKPLDQPAEFTLNLLMGVAYRF
ncbi:MAG: hypothetical protein L0Y66_03235 [Myxococcaceae bacterium]|nr:hypothetical protein [Myxococcaceae bacterium]